jgi:hypothetical protein
MTSVGAPEAIPAAPAPPRNAIISILTFDPILTATKNGNAYTASSKISQQNKPMSSGLRTSPRRSMMVVPIQ